MNKNKFLLLPPLLFALINLVFFNSFSVKISEALIMLSVSAAEEIFFRGFLLKAFFKKWAEKGIYIESAIFALCHIVNLSHQSHVYVIIQIISAFVVGTAYSYIALNFKSLLPCVAIHCITNVTSLFSSESMTVLKIILLLFCNVLIVFYLLYFRKNYNFTGDKK